MRHLASILTCAVLGATLLQAPRQSGGWLWDLANVAGFITFAGLLYLFLDVGRGVRQRRHQLISYGVAIALLAHILILWLPDETLWFYMLWDGPHYMWAGWLAVVLMITIIVLALPARRRIWHLSYQHFQKWHYWLSLLLLMTAWWHMTGSGFYLSTVESTIYATLIAAILIAHQRRLTDASTGLVDVAMIPLAISVFLLIKVALP